MLAIERQTVNYYSTIHALELIYFDSNTQETMKKRLYPSDAIALKKSRQMFDCNASVYMYFLRLSRKNDGSPANVKKTWSMRRMASLNGAK